MNGQSADDTPPGVLRLVPATSLANENQHLRAEVARLEECVRELDALAYIDPLVGLPNRRCFFKDLEHAIARLSRCGGSAAIVYVDVDGLKQINDRFGHQAGDAALIKVAQTLAASVRASDIVARLSGDEFAVLLLDADEIVAWNMALRIVENTLASRLSFGANSVSLSVATGVSVVEAGDEPHDVISRADTEMYRIKATQHQRSSVGSGHMPAIFQPRLVDGLGALHFPA